MMGPRLRSHILSLIAGLLALILATGISIHTLHKAHAQSPSPDAVISPSDYEPAAKPDPSMVDITPVAPKTNPLLKTLAGQVKSPPPGADQPPAPPPPPPNSPPPVGGSNVPPVNGGPPVKVDATNSAPGQPVKGLSEVSFLEPYAFDVREGRRNPFHPPLTLEDMKGASSILPGTPLERFELDEIKLVGIMWEIKAPKAMFIDPQGEVHILAKDDRIGRKHGYIAAIREGEVVVVEQNSFAGEGAFSTRILQIEKERKSK